MLRLLKFLFTGTWHEHQWVTINKGTLSQNRQIVGMRYTLRCAHCGKIDHKDIW